MGRIDMNVNGPFMALSFNGATGPFKNPLVRQAVAFAIPAR
jgi:ABC-type transport system substrate-binding protein